MRYDMDKLVKDTLQLTLDLLAIPSVSGDCEKVLKRVESEIASLGLSSVRTQENINQTNGLNFRLRALGTKRGTLGRK